MRKFRKGDQVVVLTGRDKGRQGAVIQVPDDEHVIVEGINTVKRHQRPNPQAGKQGGILSKEMPLHVAKIAIWNPTTKKADRVGFKVLADGKKVRRFSSNGEMLDA
ncbi:MAG TPA: 50S ribosomal protein L24 [Steroidobacteraceae bacterium]|jgi:large subunit ribosomal protein L24